MSGKDSKQIKQHMLSLLREIWDDEDFLVGVLSIIPADGSRLRMIDFLELSKELNDPLSSDHVLAAALKMEEEYTEDGFLNFDNGEKRRLLFEYEMADAWHMLISSVTLYENNTVEFCYYNDTNRCFMGIDAGDRLNQVSITDSSMFQIMEMLKEDKIYELEELDSAPDFFVMDGYKHAFRFSDGKRHAKYTQSNISICKRKYDKCPKTAYIIDVLGKLEEILVPEGVDKNCFLLEKS